MPFYPTYTLQVYSSAARQWLRTSHKASNRPHHWDYLLEQFDHLVHEAKQGSPNQAAIGYRILQDNQVVHTWDNGKIA